MKKCLCLILALLSFFILVAGCDKKKSLTPLHHAACDGDLPMVKQLVEGGADIDAVGGKNKQTPLHYASDKGHAQVVAFLADQGANIETKTKWGDNTALHLAASEGHNKIVKILLDHGADIHAKAYEDEAPLTMAAIASYADTMELLINRGADPMRRCINGYTAAHYCSSIECLEVLFQHGVDVNATNYYGETPIHNAISYKETSEMLQYLFKHGAEVNIRYKITYTEITPLHIASSMPAEFTRLLLDNGADPHARDGRGNTVLHTAASDGNIDVVKLLLEAGADINTTNYKGRTPRDKAEQRGYHEMVEYLITCGASSDYGGHEGWTALHSAARKGDNEKLQALLTYGADPDQTDFLDRTPLHEAVIMGHEAVVKLLLEKGADVNGKTKSWTPLDYAAAFGHRNISEILIKNGASVNGLEDPKANIQVTPLYLAAREGHTELVKWLLSQGAKPTDYYLHNPVAQASKWGRLNVVTILIPLYEDKLDQSLALAITANHLGVAEVLLKSGAEAKSGYWFNITQPLLCLTAWEGNEKIINLLLGHGADVNLVDRFKQTPLHWAAKGGQKSVVELLLKRGADPTLKSRYGLTPRDLAMKYGHQNMLTLLDQWQDKKAASTTIH